MKRAILGGAFDPIHIGHYLVAQQVKEQLAMDEVWLMVCYSYFPEFPEKLKRITSYEERFAMAQTFAGNDFVVSDFEAQFNKPSRTIDTLRLLEKQYPHDQFSWIIGSDALPTFSLWNEWQSLAHDHNLIVFPRDTDFATLKKRVCTSLHLSSIPPNITVLEGNLIVSTISSTHIRARVQSGETIEHFVSPAIQRYIKKHNLYT
jgi:nicotinate-nucleotide adenylyltransferase